MLRVDPGETIVRNLAVQIFVSLLDGSGRAFTQVSDAVKQKLYLASREYSQNYIERHGILKVLGMREPIPLEAVYIAVQFLDIKAKLNYESVETLEEVYHHAQQRGFYRDSYPRIAGIDVANQKQFLMVLGAPGAGKTTFLRKMGLEALKGKTETGFQHDCIPVFIELKSLRPDNFSLEETIADGFRFQGFPDPQRFTQSALEKGKLLILLDGLDEVPASYQSEVIARIQDFVDLYGKNRFIISCRLAVYRYNLRRFTDVTVADFSDHQIQNFITNWFAQDLNKAAECWQKLVSHHYVAAKELTHTPLLLTLICLLYQRAGQFPANRATLYEKALRVLLEEWAGEKGIYQETIYRGLDTKRKEILLSDIAYHAFRENHFFFQRRELARDIELILREMLPEASPVDGLMVLKSIEVQHGLLVERAEGVYSFSHLSLQEFLAAQYIADDQRLVEQTIGESLCDRRWQEIFILLAGLKQTDSLLTTIAYQIQCYTDLANLQRLLPWAEQVTLGSKGPYHPVAKRAVALFLVLSFGRALSGNNLALQSLTTGSNYVWDLTYEVDPSLAIDYLLDIVLGHSTNVASLIGALVEISNKKIFKDVRFNLLFAKLKALQIKYDQQVETSELDANTLQTLSQTFLSSLGLPTDIFQNLSSHEAAQMNDYFYANMLLIRCRKAAVRVSPQVWQTIEAGMLKLPG